MTDILTLNGNVLIANGLALTSDNGGGSTSGWTKIATQDYTVSTTSTSTTTTGTINLGNQYYTSNKIIYVKVRDKAGARNGYFVGTDAFFFNPYPKNGATTQVSNPLLMIIRKTTDGNYEMTSSKFGIYAASLDSNGNLTISQRYSSSYTLTINGTYEVTVWTLEYAPNQGNPFDYSYS